MSSSTFACAADLLCKEAGICDIEADSQDAEDGGLTSPGCSGGMAAEGSPSYGSCSTHVSTVATSEGAPQQLSSASGGCRGALASPAVWKSSDAVNWMMQMAWHLRLQSESLFLGVSYLDRLSQATDSCVRTNLTAAAACLWIAAKYSDVVHPGACHLVALSDKAFTVQQLVDMEAAVLQALNYRLACSPSLEEVLDETLLALRPVLLAAPELAAMAYYLAEMSLLEEQLRLAVPPGQLAATCCFVAAALLKLRVPGLQLLTGYSLAALRGPAELLCAVHTTISYAATSGNRPYFVTVKYLRPEHGSIAAVPPFSSCNDERIQ